jgi:endonuclease YncB( thermonuclease family)
MANTYKVEVTKTVDGDTIYGNLKLEDFDIVILNQKFRFLGVNTPEKKHTGYYEATEFTAQVCDGKTLMIDLHGKDAFGRWLVDVYYHEGDEMKWLNQELLKNKLAVVYKG